MLTFLQDSGWGCERKLRLFAAACCRRIWHLLHDERSRRAVGAAEGDADGLGGPEELAQTALDAALAFAEAGAIADVAGPDLPSALDWFYDPEDAERTWDAYQQSRQAALAAEPIHAGPAKAVALAAFAAHASVSLPPRIAAEFASGHAAFAVAFTTGPDDPEVGDPAELAAQCHLLRCVFGCSFRSKPVEPASLAWNDRLVQRLAQASYDHRLLPGGHLDPARLGILADALEDAGCPAEHELLLHLRGPGPHTRGCFAVDALLGRQQAASGR
jgi:hypothetical protein